MCVGRMRARVSLFNGKRISIQGEGQSELQGKGPQANSERQKGKSGDGEEREGHITMHPASYGGLER